MKNESACSHNWQHRMKKESLPMLRIANEEWKFRRSEFIMANEEWNTGDHSIQVNTHSEKSKNIYPQELYNEPYFQCDQVYCFSAKTENT